MKISIVLLALLVTGFVGMSSTHSGASVKEGLVHMSSASDTYYCGSFSTSGDGGGLLAYTSFSVLSDMDDPGCIIYVSGGGEEYQAFGFYDFQTGYADIHIQLANGWASWSGFLN